MEERVELSQRERDRLKVLHEVEQGHLRQREAGDRLQLSNPQVRRRSSMSPLGGNSGLV